MRFFNFLKRYISNLARLNNIKFRVDLLEEITKDLRTDCQKLQAQNDFLKTLLQTQNASFEMRLQEQSDSFMQQLQKQHDFFSTQLQKQEENLSKWIAKEALYQSLSLQQRVDQFIFDANIELKAKIAKEK